MTSTWTEADFDLLGWHDVPVHGLRVLEGAAGAGELSFDIDYILEWIGPCGEGGDYRFRIAPAVLKFRAVTSLKISLDYATPGAAMGPFSLADIHREPVSHGGGYESYRWTLAINWPAGAITFESLGFTQALTGPVVETTSQQLDSSQRPGTSHCPETI